MTSEVLLALMKYMEFHPICFCSYVCCFSRFHEFCGISNSKNLNLVEVSKTTLWLETKAKFNFCSQHNTFFEENGMQAHSITPTQCAIVSLTDKLTEDTGTFKNYGTAATW